MKVKNHIDFCCFDYGSIIDECSIYSLGDVVIKTDEDGTEIGVVIQLHDRGEVRTDMFGNACNSQLKLATIKEIEEYRPELIDHLNILKTAYQSISSRTTTELIGFLVEESQEEDISVDFIKMIGKVLKKRNVK